ncbi:hypothetical protein BC833DRAFT_625068 [Globomyces pollinis-pini]|nr:hypothetical protein BC833DRAFT_625068 [Globomyces pollinis-pini]
MLRCLLSFLLYIYQFKYCNAQVSINVPIDGRQFKFIESFQFLNLPFNVITSTVKILMDQNINCAKFIPEPPSTIYTGEVMYFGGNFTVYNSLTVDYQPQNLTADLNYATNLTETLKRGTSLDKEISEYLNMTLQSGTARLNFINYSNEVELFGSLFLPSYSTILVNKAIAKLSNESAWFAMDKNTTTNLIQVQEFSVITVENRLQFNITSLSKIVLRSAYFLGNQTPDVSTFKPTQAFKYKNCDLLSQEASRSLLSQFVFGLIFVILGMGILNSWNPNSRRRNVGRTERIYDEATLKLKAEEFLEKYPIGSVGSRELDKVTALLPQSMVDHTIAISMIPPREIADFDCFGDISPVVEIGEIDDQTGSQTVKFTGGVECNVQCNSSLVPRLLDTELPNDTLENDKLPPPAFNSIDNVDAPLECFYQVRIVTLEENNPNLALGFVTGLYPPFRLPGLCDNTIAFHCHDSAVRFGGESIPFPEIEIYEEDILGIGYYL